MYKLNNTFQKNEIKVKKRKKSKTSWQSKIKTNVPKLMVHSKINTKEEGSKGKHLHAN